MEAKTEGGLIMLSTLLTTTEVAQLLSVCPETIARWRVEGTGPRPFIRMGRAIRYHPSVIDAYISACEISSTSSGAS